MTDRPATKPPAEAPTYGWCIYRRKGTPAAFIGIVQAPTAEAAIAKAVEEFKITGEARSRLMRGGGEGRLNRASRSWGIFHTIITTR